MMLISQQEVVEIAFTPREIITAESIRMIKIDIAQEHFVRPRFGDKMYQKMVDGEYDDFVIKFIQPALAHFVRYGIIDELSIQMSDDGAMVMSSSKCEVESEGSKSDKTLQNHAQTTQKSIDNYQNKLGLSKIEDETSSTLNITQATTEYPSNVSVIKDDNEQGGKKQEVDVSESITTTGNDNQQSSGEQSLNKTLTDKQLQRKLDKNMRPATNAERQSIMRRAMMDANVLIDKAVRYVQCNPEKFEHYVPINMSRNVFF